MAAVSFHRDWRLREILAQSLRFWQNSSAEFMCLKTPISQQAWTSVLNVLIVVLHTAEGLCLKN
eukprot:1153876-Pelagomonas_calceolata.AAC.3